MAETAHLAAELGINPLPPREDGTKGPWAPGDGRWTPYKTRKVTADELDAWWGPRKGVGFLCGAISGNLEMFEFEGRAVTDGIHAEFCEAVEAAGLGDVWDRVQTGYWEKTPSGGYHFFWRCDTDSSSVKLARRQTGEGPRPLIETRGEGGYAIVAPTPGEDIHDKTNNPWELLQGGVDTIATIRPEDRDAFFQIARTFDEMPVREPVTSAGSGPSDGDRPGDRYNADPATPARTLDLLTRHGWTRTYTRQDGVHLLTRPGKDPRHGTSATLGDPRAGGMFYVFTTSSEFEPGAHSHFHVLAVLEHGGDHAAAARALAGDHGLELRVPEPQDEASPDEAPEVDDPIGAAIVDLLVLRDDPTGGTEWLQEPIAVKNANHLFVAGSGVGKSLLWLAVAAYRALGRDPFTGEPCEPLSVLYIDAENPLAAIRDRLENMGIDFAELQATGRFHYASMPDLPPLDTPAGGLAVHKYVAAHNIDLVVIDTVSSTTSPDKSENSDEVARGVTQYTTKPLIRAGKAIVRLDHESHKTASSGNGAMGSSAKRRDADIEWRMVKQDGGYKLTREKDRRAFVAHEVHLYLDDNPLRFTFQRTWPTGTFPLAAFLDEHAVPYDWTNKQVRERIAALDYQGPRRNEVVAAAIRYRNENRARIGGERLGNATSFTSGERGGTGVQQT